jgi:hypothetical protein
MTDPIEKGMRVECISDEWKLMGLIVSSPPVVGDRRTVTDIWSICYTFDNGDDCVVDYLQLLGHPEKDYFISINFKPIDGEFERIKADAEIAGAVGSRVVVAVDA